MAHLRARFAKVAYQHLKSFWPVIGILGPRQCGKSTFLREYGELSSLVSLDDLQNREEACSSPAVFLAKQSEPAGIDEAQKAPELFDAIKLQVDRLRKPGRFILSGSAQFSSRLGIRESLTGRIGLLELFPMTLAELERAGRKTTTGSRFLPETVIKRAIVGGMPVPAFARDADQRRLYWNSWIDTTVSRDLAPFFRGRYDPDFSLKILTRMGEIFRNGELPTLRHFDIPARKLRSYFEAMESIFLVRRIQCHEAGTGKEAWIFVDSGLAAYFMETTAGEESTLSLIRHFLWNEWGAAFSYIGKRFRRVYFKSAQGTPVDLVIDGIPYKIVPTVDAILKRRKWEERALHGAMRTLGSEQGFLIAPVESPEFPKNGRGIGVLPWGWWS